MKRVVVVGSQGAGKTYLAAKLGGLLNLPVTHLDEMFWGLRDELNERVLELTQQEAWIIDGIFMKTLDARVAACDTVILLDLPRGRCAWQLIMRRMKLLFSSIPAHQLGPHQRNTWPLLQAIWAFPERMKPRIEDVLRRHDAKIIVLRSRREVAQFLAGLDESGLHRRS